MAHGRMRTGPAATPSASRLLKIERIQVLGEYRTDQPGRHAVRPHRGMQGKAVEQSVQAFNLELQVESGAKAFGLVKLPERLEACFSKQLIDLLVFARSY